MASRGALTCALIPGMEEDELLALAERVGARVRGPARAPVSLGVGRAVAGGDARRSFHEARCALEALAFGERGTEATGNGATSSGTRGGGTGGGTAAGWRRPSSVLP